MIRWCAHCGLYKAAPYKNICYGCASAVRQRRLSDSAVIAVENIRYQGPDSWWADRIMATIIHEQNGLKEDLFTVWDELHGRLLTVVGSIEDARRMAATVRPAELVRG